MSLMSWQRCSSAGRLLVAKACKRGETSLRDRQYLEHRAHAATAAVGQPLQRGGDVLGDFMRGLRHQGHRAGFDAQPLQKLALRHRSMNPRAQIFRSARERLKIDKIGRASCRERVETYV